MKIRRLEKELADKVRAVSGNMWICVRRVGSLIVLLGRYMSR